MSLLETFFLVSAQALCCPSVRYQGLSSLYYPSQQVSQLLAVCLSPAMSHGELPSLYLLC